ncbi:MAG: zinc ribbon domain-containing protein [Anaerolineales bacterium]
MRRIVLLLVFVAMLFTLPANARAAPDVTLENLTIQLWPDHDELAVLVIYDFNLNADTPLPATMRFQIPSSANLAAVASASGGTLVDVAHELSAAQGNNQVVTFAITEQTSYHLEYYLPYTLEGKVRNFVFTWPGDYAVTSFNLALQKPSAATNITTDPVLADIPSDQNGFAYQATSTLKLAAGQTFSLKVRYENDNDTLSASTLKVQPSSPLTDNLPGQVSVMTYIPWVLAGLALLLIAGGIGWYWLSSRGSTGSPKRGWRVSARDKTATDATQDRQVYCHQCGKRAQADDRFCRTCGAELRRGEA